MFNCSIKKTAALGILGLAFSFSGASGGDSSQVCSSTKVTLNADFPLGRMNECTVRNDTSFSITILPEDAPPINPSPWYAFRVSPHESKIEIELDYQKYKHRYWPRVSYDAQNWMALDEKYIRKISDHKVSITLPKSKTPLFVSGQEFLTNATYENFMDRHAFKPGVVKSIIGQSAEGRTIYKLETGIGDPPKPYVVLVGRQHPPEVTGALAMLPFIDEVLGDTEIAKEFRSKFNLLIIPVLNVDGVANGHWRHNTTGKDLNRDWGPFEHKETQLIKRELDRFSDADVKTDRDLWLLLDFHSTRRNVFYTQFDKDEKFMPGFTADWIKNSGERLENYEFKRLPRDTTDLPTSKNYINTRFGVPAITYELGDNTDREEIHKSAKVFAEEMMAELLRWEAKGVKAPYHE